MNLKDTPKLVEFALCFPSENGQMGGIERFTRK
jgi:hypothetical protein